MDKGSPDASNEVTIVISRKVKPGYENEYDEWLRRYLMLEKKVPGYVGATTITHIYDTYMIKVVTDDQDVVLKYST
jgi:antibiotic biosynthesis monooxygenase (ABM) superfamily enzyme